MKQEKEVQESRRADLQNEVHAVQAEIKRRKDAQAAYQSAIDEQAKNDVPELQAWEDLLALRIEGTQADTEVLRFVFSGTDSRDKSREVWFDMDFARGYAIVETRPKLHIDEMSRLEKALASGRDMGAFLKGMRDLFVTATQ